ncbi:MAG: type I methionyl aminopeptidase [Patescibacteria group bacterium]
MHHLFPDNSPLQNKYISMRQGGAILHDILYQIKKKCHPGVNALDLDRQALSLIKENQATPSFFGFQGFPNSLIVCLNQEVVHGIPYENKIIAAGDLVTLDLGLKYRGWCVDMAISFVVGQTKNQAKYHLIEATRQALDAAIDIIKPGTTIGDIGHVIEAIADQYDLKVIYDCAGHGVGQTVHDAPTIPNFGQAGQGAVLEAGMTLALEPIFAQTTNHIKVLPDHWTIITDDNSLAAQSEHTVIVTPDGCEILTQPLISTS